MFPGLGARPHDQPRDLSVPPVGVLDSEGPSPLPHLVCASAPRRAAPQTRESKGKEPPPTLEPNHMT